MPKNRKARKPESCTSTVHKVPVTRHSNKNLHRSGEYRGYINMKKHPLSLHLREH
jgi:hypothetical protein